MSIASLALEVTVLGLEELAALRVFGIAVAVFGLLEVAAIRLARAQLQCGCELEPTLLSRCHCGFRRPSN